MGISTKFNSTALSYLSIITNKTVDTIAMKIFRFVEVATQLHRHVETDEFFKVVVGQRQYVDPCIHIPRRPPWPVMGIPLPYQYLFDVLR